MAKQRRMTSIRFSDRELVLILTLLESTIGGPTWRHNQREGIKLIGKIEYCATAPDTKASGVGS